MTFLDMVEDGDKIKVCRDVKPYAGLLIHVQQCESLSVNPCFCV
jgi:hypothetical protein